MANVLLPVGSHFFTPDALQKAADSAIAEHPNKKNVLKGTVDSNGVNVVLVMGTEDGNVKFHTSFAHDATTGTTFGAGGSVAW